MIIIEPWLDRAESCLACVASAFAIVGIVALAALLVTGALRLPWRRRRE